MRLIQLQPGQAANAKMMELERERIRAEDRRSNSNLVMTSDFEPHCTTQNRGLFLSKQRVMFGFHICKSDFNVYNHHN